MFPDNNLVGIIQIPKGTLQSRGIHFLEPNRFFLPLQGRQILGTDIVIHGLACLFVRFLPLCKIVVEHEPAAAEGAQDQVFLCLVRI